MSTSLADHLRALPDDALAALVRMRPDLVMPVPSDLSALAVRAQSRLSVARAMDGLDQFTLEILDGLRLSRTEDGVTSFDAVATLAVGVPVAQVRAAVDQLRALCLVHGPTQALHVVAGVDEVSSPYPAGLGRPAADLDPAAAALAGDPARLRRTVLAAPPPARAILDRLAAGPPLGTVTAAQLAGEADPTRTTQLAGATGPVTDVAGPQTVAAGPVTDGSGPLTDAGPVTDGVEQPAGPVRWLVDHHLLVQVGRESVELPREVALLLRRDTGPLGPLHPAAPAVDAAARKPTLVDRGGAGQAMEAVRHAEALLEAVGADPVPTLRAGGIGVRELRRLARAVSVDESVAALLLETAHAAGLLGEAAPDSPEPVILPTFSYDGWRAQSIPVRWSRLANAWLAMPRSPGLIGQRDDRDRLIALLSPEAERASAPGQRRAVLGVLAELPSGAAPAVDQVRAVLAWRAPRRAARSGAGTAADAILAEAALLGITGLGALTGYGRLLLTATEQSTEDDDDPLGVHGADAKPDAERVVAALDALLPAPVDHLLVQADLTVVVPGPPEPDLAAELALIAEPESAGGATVYRVTADSLRRALDAGYSAGDLHTVFRHRSRTPVAQGLTYLIDDVARKHGGLRTGAAGGYLRSDDEALVAEVLADRRLSTLGLRRLAPTVLVSPYPVGRLLSALREAGYAPVPEDSSGAAVLSRPKSRRAAARSGVPARRDDPLAMPRLSAPRLAGIVEQIRRGDAAARAARRAPVSVRSVGGGAAVTPAQVHIQALAVLQQALRERARVWVGYVDAHGSTMTRLLRPVSMGAGYLRAEDERSETLHTLRLERITSAAPEEV